MPRFLKKIKRYLRKIAGRERKQPDTQPAAPSTGITPEDSPATGGDNAQQEQLRDGVSSTTPILPAAPSATGNTHVQQEVLSTSPIPPATPSDTGNTHAQQEMLSTSPIPPAAPSATGNTHVQQEELSTSPIPPATPSATGNTHAQQEVLSTSPIPPAAPSDTGNTHAQQEVLSTSPIPPAAPSATGNTHVQQEELSTSPIQPAAPSATGNTHAQQEESRDHAPSLPTDKHPETPAAQSFWDQAYDALAKESPDLVNEYEDLLEKEAPTANSAANETTRPQLPEPHSLDTRADCSPRQVRLNTVIEKGLRRMEENKMTIKIAGHKIVLADQITNAADFLLWGKGWIDIAVKASPEASLVWSVVCLGLPLLTNPATAAQANHDGFVYVTSRLRYYVALEPMVRQLGENDRVNGAMASAANANIVSLYQAILDFQLSSVLRFYQSCVKTIFKDIVSSTDWNETLLDIKTREKTARRDLGQMNDLVAGQLLGQLLKALNDTSETMNTTMESYLSVATRHLAVSVEQLTVMKQQQATQADAIQGTLRAEQRAEQKELLAEQQDCLHAFWLTDSGATYDWYKDGVETRVEGTCDWFLRHERFKEWLLQESGPLLVSADPGCGKSVLAKYLIDDVLIKQPATICSFFFKDQYQNTIRQALCALLHQLFSQTDDQLFSQKDALIQHAMGFYKRMGVDFVRSEPSLWTILKDAVRDPQAGPVIFVIDALDECSDSELTILLAKLKDIFDDQRLSNAKFKVLMTSRPYDDVVSKFNILQAVFPHIRISGEEEFEAINHEIDNVIKYRVEKLATQHPLTDSHKSYLNNKLLKIQHRTYLWVHFVFAILESGFEKTKDGIDAAVEELPESVNQAYDLILSRSQKNKTGQTVNKALSIILAARRPLTLSEMNIAMKLNYQGRGRSIYDLELEQDVHFKTRLRTLCGLFVNVHQDKIYFLHQTAREFLIQSSVATTLSPNLSPNLQWHHSITTRHAHSVLAEICMYYLDRLNSTRTKTIRQGDQHGALQEYSVEYWDDHYRKAEFEKGSAMENFASGLCDPDLTSPSPWIRIISRRYHIRPQSPMNVLVASHLGLTPVAELLLSRGADVEAKDTQGCTALVYAARSGNEALARLLLANGADVESKDEDGLTALMHVVRSGDGTLLQLLLEYGADVDARNDNGMTALSYAAGSRNEAVRQLLLAHGAGVKADDNYGRTSPTHSTVPGHEAITQMLLEYGVDAFHDIVQSKARKQTELHINTGEETVDTDPGQININKQSEGHEHRKHIQQQQYVDRVPSLPHDKQPESPAAQSFWNQAYDALANENLDLVNEYDDLLKKEAQTANSAANETTRPQLPAWHSLDTRPDRSARLGQLKTMTKDGLQRMEDYKATFKIGGHKFVLEGRITEAANSLLWGKDWTDTAVESSPEASLVWPGISLIFPHLTNTTTAAEASRDGFIYVTSRMRYYVALEPMVRQLGRNAGVNEALISEVNGHIVDLYRAVLEYQLTNILHFYHSRFKDHVYDTVSSQDRKLTLLDIKTLEQTVNRVVGQSDQPAARQELEHLNNTSMTTNTDMKNYLLVATQQLDVLRKQVAAQLAAREGAKQERLLAKQQKCLQLFYLTRNDNSATYEWYKGRVEPRVEGTCNWFLQHERFQEWLSQESGPLLVSADPGCGKSVLAKYLIDDVLSKQSATICYFFFKDQDQNTTHQALCALIHQLFIQKTDLIQHAMKHYNGMGADLVRSDSSLWTILRDAVRDPRAGPVIFVIDALDECDESQLGNLIRHLENIFCDQQLKNAKFKVLMTSRPYQQVISEFHSLRNIFRRIHIPGEEEFEVISQDINRVIHYRVEQLARKHRLSDNIQSSLNSKLLAIEHRTYLWVYLVFDYLDKGLFEKTKDGIDVVIQGLPMSVNQAYDQILSRFQDDETVDTVKRVLSIILAARRPLTLSEMNIAMNLDDEGRGRSIYDLDLEPDVDFKTRLRALCGLFVNFHHDKIYFLHQTARDFLLQAWVPATASSDLRWHHSITTRHAHSVLAKICMLYLDRLNATHTGVFREDDQHGALFQYSVEHWVDHYREAEFEKSPAMVDLASRLCTPDMTRQSPWARMVSRRYHIRPGSPTNVLVAFYLELIPVIELLLSRGADVEVKDTRGCTALICAAKHRFGDEAVTRLLLKNGADVEARDDDGRTALMYAMKFHHEAVAQLLLDNGARVEAKNVEG